MEREAKDRSPERGRLSGGKYKPPTKADSEGTVRGGGKKRSRKKGRC
jgi:hypothetical protein